LNVTLGSGEDCTVLDNYNLTEGVSRVNSPLNFTYQITTERLIKSTLSDMINVTTILNVTNCSNITFIEYYSVTGNYRHNFTRVNGDWVCSGDLLTFNTTIEYEGEDFAPNFSISLPDGITYFRLDANSTTQYNMTPIGQSASVPFLNITSYNTFDTSIYMKVNLSNTCINLYASNSSNINTRLTVNETYNEIFDLVSSENQGIWLWVDYVACNVTGNNFAFFIEGRYP